MILSFWRYCHLLLAFVSTLFLIVAAITGAILACEPIANTIQAHQVIDIKDVTAATTITQLEKNYEEVLSLKVTANKDVTASVISKDGTSEDIYVHPQTGDKLGVVQERDPIFIWTTNLHRSLFLKSTGRFFVGLVSFLLCLIAISGIFLLAQRQGGFLKLYRRIKEKDFNQQYHVILGRWLLIPIIVIAATGVYLSLITFDILATSKTEHDWSKDPIKQVDNGDIADIPFFQELSLSEIRDINFPFSEDELDYYEVNLNDRDLLVHQYSGEIISDIEHPFNFILSRWSYDLHTGTGNILWSTILFISSVSLLFFIFSGFAMYFKRKRKTKPQLALEDKDSSEIVILVGSEGGSTFAFAKALTRQLSKQGKSIFLSSLNEYTTYQKATQLIILTATYGDGDAPTNARHFLKKLNAIHPPNVLQYSVVGFGSRDYDHYCRFAEKVDIALAKNDQFKPLLELQKINDQSQDEINNWLQNYSHASGIELKKELAVKKSYEYIQFEVLERSPLNLDDTFILRLKINDDLVVQSGDVLQILAPTAHKPRAYSIACIDNEILLSIKMHENGICSSYLSLLKAGDSVKAYVEENPNFHLPKSKAPVIFISNGTGIAPFLGMVNSKDKHDIDRDQYLFWGGKLKQSFDIYKPYLETGKHHINNCQVSTSRESSKTYVQDELWEQKELLSSVLNQNGTIMICGSIAMRDDVLKALEQIMEQVSESELAFYEQNGQILSDCY
ncbi:MAG: PepSY domain-containing protein [Nonlabens sp.]|uniref:PepSY domain-containing protein n=1 Tax=Nonlabens sp. TaxID=1888209 RepID=UPI00321C2B65